MNEIVYKVLVPVTRYKELFVALPARKAVGTNTTIRQNLKDSLNGINFNKVKESSVKVDLDNIVWNKVDENEMKDIKKEYGYDNL